MNDLCTSEDFLYGGIISINKQQNAQCSNQDTPIKTKSKLLKTVVTSRSYLKDIDKMDCDKFRILSVRDKLVKYN
jgi:hypothetical protein